MRNLRAEMARYGVSNTTLQSIMGCSHQTVVNKLNETTEFTIDEAFRIRDELFPGMRLEYLFQRDNVRTESAHESQEVVT